MSSSKPTAAVPQTPFGADSTRSPRMTAYNCMSTFEQKLDVPHSSDQHVDVTDVRVTFSFWSLEHTLA